MPVTIEERVAKGAALMDEKVPGWEKRIDVGRLAMGSCVRCVIGQTFNVPDWDAGVNAVWGGYKSGMESLGLDVSEFDTPNCDLGTDYGFDTSDEDAINDIDHYSLRTAWLAEIARRLNRNNRMEATS